MRELVREREREIVRERENERKIVKEREREGMFNDCMEEYSRSSKNDFCSIIIRQLGRR